MIYGAMLVSRESIVFRNMCFGAHGCIQKQRDERLCLLKHWSIALLFILNVRNPNVLSNNAYANVEHHIILWRKLVSAYLVLYFVRISITISPPISTRNISIQASSSNTLRV